MVRRLLAALLLGAICFSLGLSAGRGRDAAAEPPSGEALWRSLPPALLADVIEGKLEQIAELQDDVARLRELLESALAVARPPPGG